MTKLYEDFLTEVTPYAPNCPDIVAVNAVRNACIEFCEKSLWWLYAVPAFSTVANQSTYTIAIPAESSMVTIVNAHYTNMPVLPVSDDEINQLYPFNWMAVGDAPRYMLQKIPNEVQLVPYPTSAVANSVGLVVSLKPTRASTGVPDDIFENWAEGISYGARSRIHAIPNQPFSDPVASTYYSALFRNAVGKATIDRNRGLVRTTKRVRPPRFF